MDVTAAMEKQLSLTYMEDEHYRKALKNKTSCLNVKKKEEEEKRKKAASVLKMKAVDVNIVTVAVQLRVKVKMAAMPPLMQVQAFRSARQTLNAMDIKKDKSSCFTLAFALKQEFDECYGPAWHCIVGRSFGSFVTHSFGGFLYFSLDKLSILLFKTALQLAQ
ncbi:uncharacterized protein LOC131063031 [Cryptomeria japonica]|uniref:uncharacterized protein LOC131063031 n=1 Tax=Cryptomeria japonica TaxID=3369 RepID=UPI0025AC4CAE|nr:uncharacterized protein LOC131063031 [Cryptomeria japonica]